MRYEQLGEAIKSLTKRWDAVQAGNKAEDEDDRREVVALVLSK